MIDVEYEHSRSVITSDPDDDIGYVVAEELLGFMRHGEITLKTSAAPDGRMVTTIGVIRPVAPAGDPWGT